MARAVNGQEHLDPIEMAVRYPSNSATCIPLLALPVPVAFERILYNNGIDVITHLAYAHGGVLNKSGGISLWTSKSNGYSNIKQNRCIGVGVRIMADRKKSGEKLLILIESD
jgi:hypothetical protein